MGSSTHVSEWGKRNNMFEDKDFEILETTPVTEEVITEDIKITDDDFTLTQIDETVHEQKFQTKPTTFLKDSLKRFSKNKSSVVASYILGALLLLSFAVPLFDPSDTKNPHPKETYLAPKLFESGAGFWDGTVKYKNIAVDISAKPDAKTEEEKQEYWWPSEKNFPQHSAISDKKITEEQYVNDISNLGSFGREGYVHFGYYNHPECGYVDFTSQAIQSLELTEDLYLSVFDVYDVAKVNAFEGKEDFGEPDNYKLDQCAFYFLYNERNASNVLEEKEVQLIDYKLTHNIGSAVSSLSEPKLNISDIIKSETGKTSFDNARFAVRMQTVNDYNTCCLIGGIAFESESTASAIQKAFEDMSFTDATSCVAKSINDGYQYWSSTGVRYIYLSKAHFCSFTYDTYEAAFGVRDDYNFPILDLMHYVDEGWITFDNPDAFYPHTLEQQGAADFYLDTVNFRCEILDPVNCPIAEPITIDDFYYPTPDAEGIAIGNISVKATVTYYKYLGYKSMPKYLMGTDKSGRDMFKYVFEGLRTSLLLGVLTFAVCFLFGLVWGSICGYFGGTVDLLMERFTDILAGVPWIVVMTLIIIHMGSNFWTFALALCLTGWIGTAARTRTQFYRFRGREYVLASRTLGASDARLIAKHILPNALGTIITGAVLMIPSVIFSEATISYLGLGLKNLASLGVILSDNQAELLTSSYLLIFPAIVIALIMISFNLFGNGLRDAINPSLKGEE